MEAIDIIRNISDEATKKLVDVFLRSTYFMFQNQFHEQIEVITMGSPLSLFIVNLYMEEFEKRSIDSSLLNP